MSRFLHRIVLLLIVTLVVNAGGWTFNRDAMADVMADAREAVVLQADAIDAQIPADKTPCNHWCHAVGHFVGMPTGWQVTFPSIAPELFSVLSYPKISSQPDGLFRPPRTIS